MDQENLNPIGIFVTLSEQDAKSWEARLRHMDGAAKAADRAILLGGPAQYHFDWQFRRTGRLGWSAMAHGI